VSAGHEREREQGEVGSGAAEAIEPESWGQRASSGVASFVWAKFKVRKCDHDYARARQGLVGQVQDGLKAWSSLLARLSKALRTPCETRSKPLRHLPASRGFERF
jgi:hypothetical protein